MSKLPAITSEKLIKILETLGFRLDHSSRSHFIFYHHLTKRRAAVPRPPRVFPQGKAVSILREAGVT